MITRTFSGGSIWILDFLLKLFKNYNISLLPGSLKILWYVLRTGLHCLNYLWYLILEGSDVCDLLMLWKILVFFLTNCVCHILPDTDFVEPGLSMFLFCWLSFCRLFWLISSISFLLSCSLYKVLNFCIPVTLIKFWECRMHFYTTASSACDMELCTWHSLLFMQQNPDQWNVTFLKWSRVERRIEIAVGPQKQLSCKSCDAYSILLKDSF